jgi:hypothetical protein
MISAGLPVGMDLVASKSGMLCFEKSVPATRWCGIARYVLAWTGFVLYKIIRSVRE